MINKLSQNTVLKKLKDIGCFFTVVEEKRIQAYKQEGENVTLFEWRGFNINVIETQVNDFRKLFYKTTPYAKARFQVLMDYLGYFDWLPVCDECARSYFKIPDDFQPKKEDEFFKVHKVDEDIEIMNFIGTKIDGSPLDCKIGDCRNLADYQLYVVGAGL